MRKNLLAILFSLLFLTLVMAPTIIVVVDSTIDISFVYDMSEEEEEKGSEHNKELEKLVVDLGIEVVALNKTEDREVLKYTFKSYQKPHLNLIFPPPEFKL
jgi:hypothetical protein